MKRFTACLIIISLMINCSYASAYNKSVIKEENDIHDEKKDSGLNISAKSAVLIENNRGRILYQQKKDEELIPASITKIMTLILIFEAIHNKKI